MNKDNLYSTILIKSRDINLFKICNIKDNLNNKIILFLIFFSFIFNKLKNKNLKKNQKIFDFIFLKIETDLREIGFGDMSLNKKMKIIINKFYSILISFNDFLFKEKDKKIELLNNLLTFNNSNYNNVNNLIKKIDTFAKTVDLISTNDIYKANF